MAEESTVSRLTFAGNIASGNARQHNGNVYNNYQVYRDEYSRIRQWLAAPDHSFSHFQALSKRAEGTGNWMFASEEYHDWLHGEVQHLWIHGGPGAGKTVICSAIVEALQRRDPTENDDIVIYHYFSFSDQTRHTYAGLLSSLVSQLMDSSQLDELRQVCDKDQRHPKVLEKVLLKMLADHQSVFILLDALDECPINSEYREEILSGLDCLLQNSANLQLLVTSRSEPDIKWALGNWNFKELDLRQHRNIVANDIDTYIKRTIDSNPTLSRLPHGLQEEIRITLSEKADGMFRWVACQLDLLRRQRLLKHATVHRILADLPISLDETYNRILLENADIAVEARTVLQWLVFGRDDGHYWGKHGKTLYIDACLINTKTDTALWSEQRAITEDIFDHLSSLVHVEQDEDSFMIGLAHSTVEEYLLSKRIRTSAASFFALTEPRCDHEIAQTCIEYIMDVEHPDSPSDMARYARENWWRHQMSAEVAMSVEECVGLQSAMLRKMAKEESEKSEDVNFSISHHALCLASRYGLIHTMNRLLKDCMDINAPDAIYGSILQAACYCTEDDAPENRVMMIERLVQDGADVDGLGGEFGSCLLAACASGRSDIVAELLRAGANPNGISTTYGTALQFACDQGAVDISKQLVEAGADVDFDDGDQGPPLLLACQSESPEIAEHLIRSGAKTEFVDDDGNNLINIVCLNASRYGGGHKQILDILIRAGVDVNATNAEQDTALHLACNANDEMIKALIVAGTDIQAKNAASETPLHLACARGKKCIVEALLEAGANVNARRSDGATPLELAERRQNRDVLTIEALLKAGAESQADSTSLPLRPHRFEVSRRISLGDSV